MNYDFSEKEFSFFIELHEMLAEFAENHPMDDTGQSVYANIRDAVARLARTPYLRFAIENPAGFSGMSTLMGAMETVAAVSPSLFLTVEYSTRIFGRALATWADEGQKQKWLHPILDGERLGALALCEETVSVDSASMATTGEKQGESIVVSGRKQFVVNASLAPVIGVVGLFDGKPAIFLVEKDCPGLVVENPETAFGYPGAAISALRLDNCKISEQNVIVPGGKEDLPNVLRFWENQVLLGASLGLMKSAFETARDHAKSHRSGGKPIIAYQEIGFKLAEMMTYYQSAQLLAFRTAWTADNDAKAAGELTLCAKVYCTESAETVAGEAMKILGSRSYFGANNAERAYRCAKFGQVFGTSTELSRVKIGDAALGVRA
ncbi:MAG: acyl-CoA dehydrogenase family protein [Thermodesulfobacteriota bacterium]